VFLTILDDFTGVLFLATNRVGLIDEALKMRVHVALAFKRADGNTSKIIWKSHVERQYKHGDSMIVYSKKELLRWARHAPWSVEQGAPWNGRQIRNAIQAAIALAAEERRMDWEDQFSSDNENEIEKSSEKIQLTSKHLDKVAHLASAFHSYR
jgi:SpoVK/Ycf46/Vps4 family AAA+-type ATPase